MNNSINFGGKAISEQSLLDEQMAGLVPDKEVVPVTIITANFIAGAVSTFDGSMVYDRIEVTVRVNSGQYKDKVAAKKFFVAGDRGTAGINGLMALDKIIGESGYKRSRGGITAKGIDAKENKDLAAVFNGAKLMAEFGLWSMNGKMGNYIRDFFPGNLEEPALTHSSTQEQIEAGKDDPAVEYTAPVSNDIDFDDDIPFN